MVTVTLWPGNANMSGLLGPGNQTDRVVDQMGQLLAAGLPLASGLSSLSAEIPDIATRKALLRLATRLESGATLEEALADDQVGVPGHLRALLLAGLHSGRLPEVLSKIAGEAGIGGQIRRRFWISLIYPVFLMGFCTLVLGLISSTSSLEGIRNLPTDFGISIPVVQTELLAVSGIFFKIGPWLFLGPAMLIGMLSLMVRLLFPPPDRLRLLLKIPVVGPLYQATSLADFFQVLSWLVDANIPLPTALPLAGEGTGDSAIKSACVAAATRVQEGQPLAMALAGTPPFPDGLGQFLGWAEQSGSTGEALRLASSMFEVRANNLGRFSSMLVSAFVLTMIAIWVGLLTMGLYLPLLSMIQLLGALSG